MIIAILGAGAMGSLLGGFLTLSGHEVTLINIWAEHVQQIKKHGLEVDGLQGKLVIPAKATTDPAEVGQADLVIVAVKAYDTEKAVASSRPLIGEHTAVLTLQNGIGNVESISKSVPADRIIAGVTSHGATLLGPGRIRHAGQGSTYVGKPRGAPDDAVRQVAGLLNGAGIHTSISDDVLALIWSKLLINVGINALTAITRLVNGDLLQYEGTETVLAQAIDEAAQVAARKGIRIPDLDPVARAREVAALTGANRSSMLQDILRKKRTEIDFINGAIVKEASQAGIAVPVNQVLTLIVKTLEQSYPRTVST